jgi:hypothetical protein
MRTNMFAEQDKVKPNTRNISSLGRQAYDRSSEYAAVVA